MIGALATSYQEARASLDQLDEVLKLEPATGPLNAKSVQKVEKIEYKNVSLQYGSTKEDLKNALTDVSLTINTGETVAFVGPSGSGKSSMIKLLAGLYDPTKGQVLVNDLDIKSINISDLRQRIGLVAQETQLFAGTIRENLLFVRPNATDQEMLTALEASQAKVILEKSSTSSAGLDTRIGEGGLKLSGGEKQRLAIARALLRTPDLMVFDEATSSLDSITEKAITETIKHIDKSQDKITTVLVAHRLSTVAHANRIYVFEKGRVVETGTHDELVKKPGLYAALWREQIGMEK